MACQEGAQYQSRSAVTVFHPANDFAMALGFRGITWLPAAAGALTMLAAVWRDRQLPVGTQQPGGVAGGECPPAVVGMLIGLVDGCQLGLYCVGRGPALVAAVEQAPGAERRDGGGHLVRKWRAGDVEPQPSQLAGHSAVRVIVADKHSAEELHPIGEQR
jgi:hypothetical protein